MTVITKQQTLPRYLKNGRMLRNGATWDESRYLPATSFVLANMKSGHNPETYRSKSKDGICKNEYCLKPRRSGSAFCSGCSKKYHNEKK